MAGVRQTWDLDDFGAGIDLRDGLWSRNQARLRDLRNCVITKGRRVRRRPPCIQDDITLDADCQGLVSVDGTYYTFAKKGDSITHTGSAASLVTTLYFDNPDLCTTWELGEFQVFDGYAAAWIIHTYPSATYPKLAVFHVWDQLAYAPTYVQDPYLPGSFSPSIADLDEQRYDATFRPVLGQGTTKLWTSTIRGNAHASRTADGRIWNQRTVAGIKEEGDQYCFVVPEGAGTVRRFLVPRDAAALKVDARWAYYVLEKATGTAWVPMTEVDVAPTVNGTYRASSVASRFAGGWNEIAIDVKWDSASAGMVRFRLVVGAPGVEITSTVPSVSAVPASGAGWKLSVGAVNWRHRGGDGQTTGAHETATLSSGATYLLAVTSDAGTFPELVDISGGFPNGWQCEHRAFIKRISTPSTATGATAVYAPFTAFGTISGTVTVAAGAAGIAGASTAFLTQIGPGSTIRVNGEIKTVNTVTDDVTADITTTWANNAGPGAGIETLFNHYAMYDGANTQVSLTLTTLVVGNNVRINSRDYTIIEVVTPGVYKVTYGGASGNYVSFLDAAYTAYLTDAPTISDYQYAYESDQDNAWYTNLIAEFVNLAGAEDALSISAAAHDNTGGTITSIASVRNRMLVTYAGSMQLWSIDQDTNRTAFLDSLQFGTDTQAHPSPVPFYGAILVPTAAGFRSISVVGANTDNIQDTNVGEPVATMAPMDVQHAAFWPWFGQYVVAGIRDGALVFQVLDYSREAKITAWGLWGVVGMTAVDPGTLIADGRRLRWRSGQSIYHFDAQATAFRDFGDAAGNAYESYCRLHYNDMGKPGLSKRFVSFDVVQDGQCQVGFELPPYGTWDMDGGPAVAGPVITGTTYGRARLPISLTGPAIAPSFSSRDETGWELQRVAIDFLMLRR